MNLKERVIAQINHRETDRIPYTIDFEGDVAERLDAYYGSAAWRDLIDNSIRHIPGPNLGVDEKAGPFYTDPFGSTWRLDRRPFHLVEPALKEPSLDNFKFPDVDACFEPKWKERALQAIDELKDHFLVVGFGFGLFERTWTLRGFNEALMDSAADPNFYDELVERVANHQMEIIERLLELPVDGIMFSDDWGYQRGVLLGPERWRHFLKPRLARMYARVHEKGKYAISHCCGSVADVMPDIIEIGLDVLQSVQPEAMNPYELKRLYGDEIAFWGGLGSQSTIPFGTPDEIRAEVERLCREMGRGGGYILGPAKALQPETPTENAAAVVEAFLKQAGKTFP
ncbi:MAG: uroporphyrinogen decarboxylase family protein [bacterium]